MMEKLEASIKEMQQDRAMYNMEASTCEPIHDESEEQVFEDCSDDEETEDYWKQIDEHNWRLETRKKTSGTPTELHTAEEIAFEECWKKLGAIRGERSATQPMDRPGSRPQMDSDREFSLDDFTEKFDDFEPARLEISVLIPRVPFARKRFDLSIYTFDEPEEEHIKEEARDMLTADKCEEEYNDGAKFVRTKFRKRRPRLKRVKSKEERSHSKQTKKLSSSKRPLKQTHWNSGKRSRGRNRGKCVLT